MTVNTYLGLHYTSYSGILLITNKQRIEMPSNSPFENHGITHLSASQINSWIGDPAGYLAGLAGLTSRFGPAAWRGTAVEKGIQAAVTGDPDYLLVARASFEKENIANQGFFADVTINKEYSAMDDYIRHGLSLYNNFGPPAFYQQKIVHELDDLEIPFVGYIDFLYDDQIRDTKTTARKPSNLTHNAARQLSIYNWAYPDKECWVDYITPREVVSWKVHDVKFYQDQVLSVALGLRKFLSTSDSTIELCRMFYPNFDDWKWNKDMEQQSKKIWSDEQ